MKETLEELSKRLYPIIETDDYMDWYDKNYDIRNAFINGAKWQQERSYSEEEVLNKLTHFAVEIQRQNKKGVFPLRIKEWFERNKNK